MTGKILNSKINHKLKHNRRSVLLFMDNVGYHPADIAEKYSNIKIIFQYNSPGNIGSS